MDLLFHHLGIATKEIDKTKSIYLNLGFISTEIIFDPIQNVNICFLTKKDHPLLELVAPINEDSPVFNIIKKLGTTPYHICYEVDNLDEAIKNLKKQRFILTIAPVKAIAFKNRRICFLYNQQIGLTELLEKEK